MSRVLIISPLALALFLGLAACGKHESSEEAHAHEHEEHTGEGAHAEEGGHEDSAARTTIAAKVAEEAGVKVEVAGKAVIRDQVHLLGSVALNADRHAAIKARFDGTVREVRVRQGDRVKRGQALLIVEGNESMREYPVTAPFDGVVLTRATNVGDVTGGNVLMEVADLSRVWIELHALGDVATRIQHGQNVRVQSATGELRATARISALLPVATRGQSVIARAVLDNPDGHWRPGMAVSAEVAVSEREVPLAVRESALQRLDDAMVVFVREGETYQAHAVTLGARDGEFAEVLPSATGHGLEPGAEYVTAQSFLIKADIEKAGAAHEH